MSVVQSVVLRRPEIVKGLIEDFSPVNLPVKEPRSIVIAGIGSSAAGGVFLEPFSPYPVIVSRDIKLPRFVSEKDLVIVSSYSGKTAETLMALRDALNRNITPIVLSSGGTLLEVAKKLNLPYVQIKPPGYTSRAMVAPIIVATYLIVQDLVPAVKSALKKIPAVLEEAIKDEQNIKEIALRVGGRVVVSVGFDVFRPGMKRIIAEFSENAKLPAFYVDLPEGNHNYFETLGHPAVIHLYPEHEWRTSLAPYTKRLNDKEHVPIRVKRWELLGNFEILVKAALASIALARLLGRDPDKIERIEAFKNELFSGVQDLFKRI